LEWQKLFKFGRKPKTAGSKIKKKNRIKEKKTQNRLGKQREKESPEWMSV
jgi:hypothetical protein